MTVEVNVKFSDTIGTPGIAVGRRYSTRLTGPGVAPIAVVPAEPQLLLNSDPPTNWRCHAMSWVQVDVLFVPLE